jgi:hypothetical protein
MNNAKWKIKNEPRALHFTFCIYYFSLFILEESLRSQRFTCFIQAAPSRSFLNSEI